MVSIRASRNEDLPTIAAIYAEAVTNGTASYELEPPSLAEMTARRAALVDAGYPYVVAEDGQGRVLGYAYAGPFRPRRAYRFMVEDSIYLAPQARGQGIGRMLLDTLVRACTDLGFRQIAAVIGDAEHNLASVRLHAAAGFVQAGRLNGSGYKHGRWLDTVFMQMTVNGGTDRPPDPESLPEHSFRQA